MTTVEGPVQRLYPQPSLELPLEGLYLALELRRLSAIGATLTYSSFVSSADGRVSVPQSKDGQVSGVPSALGNARDWRLYQELAAQADVLVTSGRYIRDAAAGRAGPMATWHEDAGLDDLAEWRAQAGLPRLPDLAIVSRNTDFDPAVVSGLLGNAVVITGTPSSAQATSLERHGVQVVETGDDSGVTGGALVGALGDLGYKAAFVAGGPRLLHTLIVAQALDLLFVTVASTLLGGEKFASLVEGPLLEPPTALHLEHLFLDEYGPSGLSQLFATYRAAGS